MLKSYRRQLPMISKWSQSKGKTNIKLPQFALVSSDPSMQSFTPSQTRVSEIQWAEEGQKNPVQFLVCAKSKNISK